MWTSIRNHCHFLANSLGEFEFTEPSLGVTLGLGGTHITHITHFIGCPSTYIDPLCHVQCIGHPKKKWQF
jgi:hypothetical protein